MKTKRINYCKNDKFINFQVLSHCVHIPHFGYFILLNYKKTHMNFQLKSITDSKNEKYWLEIDMNKSYKTYISIQT